MPTPIIFGGVAASLDGYIASATGDLAWLNDALAHDEDYGFAETMQRTGAYVMGANTYRVIGGMGGSGGGDTPTYVLTHAADLARPRAHVHFYSGDVRALAATLRSTVTKDICVFGGGQVLAQFLQHDLLDELSLAIIPVLLGGGVPLSPGLPRPARLRLAACVPFPSGIVSLRYDRPPAPARRLRRARAP